MKHSWLERLNLLKINDISLAVIAAVKLLHTMTEFDAYHIAFLGGKLIHRIAKESAYKLVGMHGTQDTLNHNLARFPGFACLLAHAILHGKELDYLKLFHFLFLSTLNLKTINTLNPDCKI